MPTRTEARNGKLWRSHLDVVVDPRLILRLQIGERSELKCRLVAECTHARTREDALTRIADKIVDFFVFAIALRYKTAEERLVADPSMKNGKKGLYKHLRCRELARVRFIVLVTRQHTTIEVVVSEVTKNENKLAFTRNELMY